MFCFIAPRKRLQKTNKPKEKGFNSNSSFMMVASPSIYFPKDVRCIGIKVQCTHLIDINKLLKEKALP